MQGRLHLDSLKSTGNGPIHSPASGPINTKRKRNKQNTQNHNKTFSTCFFSLCVPLCESIRAAMLQRTAPTHAMSRKSATTKRCWTEKANEPAFIMPLKQWLKRGCDKDLDSGTRDAQEKKSSYRAANLLPLHMEIYTPVHVDCMCCVSGCNLHGGYNKILLMFYLGRTLKLM